MHIKILPGVLALAMIVSAHTVIAESQLDIGLGYEQTSGNYGMVSDTRVTTVPLTVQLRQDAWRFRLTIPYISITGDGSIIPGTNGVVSTQSIISMITAPGTGPASMGIKTRSGLGDITTSLSYGIAQKPGSAMFYEITGEVKWGTANADKYLGTGQNDYSLGLYSVYEKYDLRPYLSFGYRVIGDTDIANYNDVVYATVGVSYPIGSATHFSVAYDYQQATLDTTEAGRSASLYASTRFDKEWSANVYVSKGLSDSVADTGAGLTVLRSY